MSSNDKLWNELVASISHGGAQGHGGATRDLGAVAQPQAQEKRGFDPYNSSGSFDRKKNWNRVGKR